MPPRKIAVARVCRKCAKEFTSHGTRLPYYCSNACKTAWYYIRDKEAGGRVKRFSYNEEEDVMG